MSRGPYLYIVKLRMVGCHPAIVAIHVVRVEPASVTTSLAAPVEPVAGNPAAESVDLAGTPVIVGEPVAGNPAVEAVLVELVAAAGADLAGTPGIAAEVVLVDSSAAEVDLVGIPGTAAGADLVGSSVIVGEPVAGTPVAVEAVLAGTPGTVVAGIAVELAAGNSVEEPSTGPEVLVQVV